MGQFSNFFSPLILLVNFRETFRIAFLAVKFWKFCCFRFCTVSPQNPEIFGLLKGFCYYFVTSR